MLNEDVQWLRDISEAFSMAVTRDSISLARNGDYSEGDKVIQMSIELAGNIASRMRKIADKIENFQ